MRLAKRIIWLVLISLLVVIAVIINAPGLTALYYQWRYTAVVAALPPAPAFTARDRVLVISPHPDDESLCCAGMIQQALAAKATVTMVWLTSGDGFELDALLNDPVARVPAASQSLASRRMVEARAAARLLGVPNEQLFFLAYPDGGLEHLLLEYYDTPYTSRYTGLNKVTYPDALSPGVAYTGQNLMADLTTVIGQVNPTLVLAPSPRDHHPDHRATGDLTLRLFSERGELAKVRWWMIHGGLEYPLPKGFHPNLPLYPAPRGQGLMWQRVDLTKEQVETKWQAIRAHHSQMEILGRFMEAFVRRNELVSTEALP
jgi:LmbE family N-acetylglucosaminyl deacetylase